MSNRVCARRYKTCKRSLHVILFQPQIGASELASAVRMCMHLTGFQHITRSFNMFSMQLKHPGLLLGLAESAYWMGMEQFCTACGACTDAGGSCETLSPFG